MTSQPPAPYPRKLIEVDLPLNIINAEAAREKSIRHGHPSTLHLWWARRPLAACRAVLFASLVDDPSAYLTDTEEIAIERAKLHELLGRLGSSGKTPTTPTCWPKPVGKSLTPWPAAARKPPLLTRPPSWTT